MARSKKEQERYLEKRKEMKKLSMRKAREKMRGDPVKYEEAKAKDRERYKRKRQEGKIKSINEMSSRDQRLIRKAWKKRSEKYRLKKKSQEEITNFVESNTPPSSPFLQQEIIQPSTSRQQETGKKQARKNREMKNKEIKELQEKLKRAHSKVNKYKKRLSRIQSSYNKETPRKQVAKIIRKIKAEVTPEVKKKLLFAEVISKQIKENYKLQTRNKDRRKIAESVSGKVVQKYKFAEYLASLTSAGSLRTKRYYRRIYLKNQIMSAKKEVMKFLCKDESSRLTAGKKETITMKKIKKQKRLLNDSLKNLHKKFVIEYPMYKNISYSIFCKFRPFWVVSPSVANRNTCLCKIHDNMKLLISRIAYHKMLKEKNNSDLVKALCCEKEHVEEICLERKCPNCIHKIITPNEFNSEESTYYDQWKSVKVSLIIKGKPKICQKVVKERVECTKEDLLKKLKETIFPFMQHWANIKHQYEAISDIKKKLGKYDVLLHFDFSENFNCKYSEEIQSARFGGSKPQITLHTSVCYYHSETENIGTKPKHQSFCTLSKSLRHDPAAITAHLDCVLDKIKQTLVPNLKTIDFVSNGPSTQYRNKTMFYLFAKHITQKLKVEKCSWNYCEAGHGKGAPDGVGGCLKRTADGFIARGTDIPNFEKLVSLLKNATKIAILTVSEEDIKSIDMLLPKKEELMTFQGTMKIHQITWSKISKSTIQARRLSCTSCPPEAICRHFGIGSINFSAKNLNHEEIERTNPKKKLSYTDVYSDSEEEDSVSENSILNNDNIDNGDWVAVIYDSKWYPGAVEQIQGENVYVNFMHKSNGNNFYWPSKPDKQILQMKTVLCKISNPPFPVSSRIFKMKDEDYQKVEKTFESV